MMEKIRKWNRTLLELEGGIVLFGLVVQAVGVWFVPDKSGCSIGLWIGIVMSMISAWHMNFVLDRAFDGPEEFVTKQIIRGSVIRYIVLVLVYMLTAVSGIGNPIASFVGMLGMKVAAYIQPFTHKLCNKVFHEVDPIPEPLPEEEIEVIDSNTDVEDR
jgi:hypothetical protein